MTRTPQKEGRAMFVDVYGWLVLAFCTLVLLRNVSTWPPCIVYDGLMVVILLVMLQRLLGVL